MACFKSTSIPRYFIAQVCLGVAVGLVIAVAMLAGDIASIRTLLIANHPCAVLVFLAGSIVTFAPLVIATAIGMLAFERDD
jgi:hypothetical protein